ncbi:MAG: DUF4145 domain-containing protein [Lysobacter sp.]|nr:MAG: DUF4145 domain-containing protein [Lysobacter sp.]
MTVNRELWRRAISERTAPRWACPTCLSGHLRLNSDEDLRCSETAESAKLRLYEPWEPEWIKYVFVAMLRCDNSDCNESVCTSGVGRVEQFIDHENVQIEYVDQFYPKWVSPSPRLISIPEEAATLLGDSLGRCFSNAWGDFAGAGNHLRKAVEILIEHFESENNLDRGKKKLHDRIIALRPICGDVSDKLLAIKWIGNSGSHIDDLSQDDIFDALDILEWVLSELFDNTKRKIDLLTARINEKKGPLSKQGPPQDIPAD